VVVVASSACVAALAGGMALVTAEALAAAVAGAAEVQQEGL